MPVGREKKKFVMSMQTYFGFGLLVECGKALTLE